MVRRFVTLATFFIGSVVTASGSCMPVAATPGAIDPATARRIDVDVRKLLQRFDVPGAAVAVIQGGKVRYTQVYGWRDREHRLPVQVDTLFEIGSITKQFTAAAILQLQEAGKLDIDKPLATYLPKAPHADEVTLRQLLNHTSGLHDYFDGPEQEVDRLASQPISYEQLIARIADRPLDFTPGSQWSYSNTGYQLLGQVIETLSGQSYEAYLQRHILDRLGMAHTFTTARETTLANVSVGYRHEDGALKRSPYFHPDWSGPAGFLLTTLGDLARWDAALRDGKVISRASVTLMRTPSPLTQGGSTDYGLGLFVDSVFDQPRIGHTGGAQGFTTADEYFPRQDIRIIAFTNSGDKKPEAGETLTNALFARLYPGLVTAAERPVAGEKTTITASARAAFAELQAGTGYTHFTVSLRSKLSTQLGTKLAAEYHPYGKPAAVIFKGTREDEKGRWYRYVLSFGSGVYVPYAIRVDDAGSVAGISFG